MNRGSFLLEIAIGLSVIGLMSGFFITKQVAMHRISRERRTKANIEFVAASIASFVASNYRIPRPASENGIESTNPTDCIGTIPYNTLGIPEQNTLDGRGRPLKYIIEPELAFCNELYPNPDDVFEQMDSRNNSFCKDISIEQHKITIKNQDCVKDPVVFVLDTSDAKILTTESGTITVIPGANTFWIRRAMLLIDYIKTSPYRVQDYRTQEQHYPSF